MNEAEDYGLFPDLPFVEPKSFEPHTTCAKCEHIIGVRFTNSNLFFCTVQKGGRYGKKIIKSAPNCEMFVNGEGDIPLGDGYYGGQFQQGLSRGKDESA